MCYPLYMNRTNLIIITVIVVCLTGLYFISKLCFSQVGEAVVVQKNNVIIARYELDRDVHVAIDDEGQCIENGSEYTNLLIIENGMASISDADCPDRICVNTKPVKHVGEAIVCLPNMVIITVE